LYRRDFSFARNTTIGCGGIADVAFFPRGIREATALIGILQKEGTDFCLLGAGANVLAADGNYHGAVVCFRSMRRILVRGNRLFAEAGVGGGALCDTALRRGLGGLEPLSGIPLTVGGATAMNAGVEEGHISDCIEDVLVCCGGTVARVGKAEASFGEKCSIFGKAAVVLGVGFRLTYADRENILCRLRYFLKRRAHLPKGHSMGCVFVNPKGVSAGKLIENSGCKGLRVGGAFVSSEHANFVISEGSCAEDVSRLIAIVRDTVYRQTGILLREEIRRIPERI